ncbi:MAG: NRDE family protein [Steroidobacteraceae bacterium]
MCLIVLAWQIHPRHDLVLAANRDELYSRPTRALDRWRDQPGLAAGRDLTAAGTWLAVHEDGRFAAVTNFHDGQPPAPLAPSRGDLVAGYFAANEPPRTHAQRLAARAADFAGFNLLLGDADSLWYLSNRAPAFAQPLAPGVHALSNHLLGTAWPKLQHGVEAMNAHVDRGSTDLQPLFTVLQQRSAPGRGIQGLPWPASSGPFVSSETFGTRSSTVVTRERRGAILIEERSFGPGGTPCGAVRLTLCPRMAA